jgi:hypothetical protein
LGRDCGSCPSEHSASLLKPSRSRGGSSSGNWLLVQSSKSAFVLPIWVGQSHFAVGRFPGRVVFRRQTRLVTVRWPVEPSLRASPSLSRGQRNLANQPQPVSRSHGLSFPTALEVSEVHLMRVLPARYVPPSGFGYPLDGFLPLTPRRLCFAPAALLGFHPSELSPPERYPRRHRRDGPTYRLTRRSSGTEAPAGPTRRGFWAFTLSRSPLRSSVG